MIKKTGAWLFVLVLCAAFATAQNNHPYHLKILAVEGEGEQLVGSGADLYLELRDGSGRVFLETTPLTKMDTQISTKFAKEIACSHFKLDCRKYDFIFTIRAQSNIVGGPSAGAAIAALTTIAVLDLKYDEMTTITGTINSGGIIGQVGGVKEKLDAAAEAGMHKVLVAQGSGMQRHIVTNQTTNLITYGRNRSLEVLEVEDIDQVILQFTGINLDHQPLSISENTDYTKIMHSLQQLLCNRTQQIETELASKNVRLPDDVLEDVQQKKAGALNASEHQDYYSAASYCFSANINLKKNYYTMSNVSLYALNNLFRTLEQKTNALDTKLARQKVETIADIQTIMIVKERLNDVHQQIKLSHEKDKSPEEMAGLLAYAEERYFSALSWMDFFALDGKKFVVNPELLRNSCQRKISEAEERVQYAELYLNPQYTQHITEKIQTAHQALDGKEYELCLIMASQGKADANAILSTLGLEEANLPAYIQSKRKAVERIIAENSAEGVFPILGFSYYQYANSLQNEEPFTALVYLEYALEMSDLSIYFPEQPGFLERAKLPTRISVEWWYAVGGLVIGVVIGALLFRRKKGKVEKKAGKNVKRKKRR